MSIPYTPKELAHLKRIYPDTSLSMQQIAEQLGRTRHSVYRMSCRLSLIRARPNNQPSGRVAAIMQAAARPCGVRARELTEWSTKAMGEVANRLVHKGQLFRLRVTYKDSVYFTTEAARDAAAALPQFKPVAKPTFAIRTRPGWGRDAPMIFTPETIYTYAPPPPVRVLRTSTHAAW